MSIRSRLLAAFIGITLALVGMPAAADNAAGPRDGSSSARAAASCWDIKQQVPAAPSGAYWLLTPQMAAPEQFFCDQTMDGGGWVLVGRGREGWDTYSRGQGDPADLLTRERTPAQFATVQLSDDRIDALLGGTAVKDLADPVRIVRAANVAGTAWQNVDLKPNRMTGWSWAFRSRHTAAARFDGGPWTNVTDFRNRFERDAHYQSLNMSPWSNRRYRLGYAYGANLALGSTSATSFLWRDNSSALPYAEVYVRPRLSSSAGFESIPDSGTQERLVEATVSELSTATRWGVVGNLNGRRAEGNAPVQAFAQLGSTIFVGGNFTGVQRGRQGSPVPRTALAAFHSKTGAFIESFNVTFNNQVKDLLVLPNGKLLAVGDFTLVNGSTHVGTVLLDPVTGEVDQSWDLQITNRLASSGGVVSVRAVSLAGDRIYLGGYFTHLSGQGRQNIYGRMASRVDLTGKPDRDWNPEFNGSIMAVDTNADLGRFYAAGYFTKTKAGGALKAAVVSTAAGAPMALDWTFQPAAGGHATYQQAVGDSGALVFFGGAEHSLQGHERNTMTRVSGSITQDLGGDLQAIATDGVTLYAGCHCFDYAYEDSYSYPNPGNFAKANRIQAVGAWDAATGAQYSWTPYLLRSANGGAWSLFVADDGALWVGGDFTASRTTSGRDQWNGGWVRYPARDRVAPVAPSGLLVLDNQDDTVTLSWQQVEPGLTYQVLRDDRVVATTTELSMNLPMAGQNRYFVRAVDAEGNIGASTPVALPVEPDALPPSDTVLISQETSWAYRYAPEAPAADWMSPEFDASSWLSGEAPLGYGSADLGTPISPGPSAERPITSYYRASFEVANPAAAGAMTLSYRADDGAVVYLNGVEISRTRMPEGVIGHDTRASTAISATSAAANPVTLTLPRELLVEGENVIAVESHLNYRSGVSMTFSATLTETADGG